jgi:hypothetical protein
MSHSPPEPASTERIERLELRIAELEERLRTVAPRERRRSRTPVEVERRTERWEYRSEQWLGRVGLGLFFLGIIYLFQYSIEQGWITPAVRVGIGLAIASGMLWVGIRVGERRRSFGQILLAGSVAVYYASGWAAFQLYGLVGHMAALGYMSGVTAFALLLSLRRDQPALASLGAAGGFLTPLLLQRGDTPVTELAVYTMLVVGWAGWVYAVRGWRTLLWTYALGSLAALALAAGATTAGERPVVQAALVVAWLLAGAFPFARAGLVGESVQSDRPSRPPGGRLIPRLLGFPLQLRALGVGVSSGALLLTAQVWTLGDPAAGRLFLLVAGGYAGFAYLATRRQDPFARSAAPVAAALCATGTFLLLSDAAVLVALLSVQAFAFVWIGRGDRFAGTEWVGHTLFGVLALNLLRDGMAGGWTFLDPVGAAQFLQIALLVAASFHLRGAEQRWIYRVAAHLLFLGWLGKELSPISAGRATVTVAWGIYGAILLAAALHWRHRGGAVMLGLQALAFSALALAVAKLLAVDLVRVAMLWRVVLFMGFGATLLALSSMVRPRMGPSRDAAVGLPPSPPP